MGLIFMINTFVWNCLFYDKIILNYMQIFERVLIIVTSRGEEIITVSGAVVAVPWSLKGVSGHRRRLPPWMRNWCGASYHRRWLSSWMCSSLYEGIITSRAAVVSIPWSWESAPDHRWWLPPWMPSWYGASYHWRRLPPCMCLMHEEIITSSRGAVLIVPWSW